MFENYKSDPNFGLLFNMVKFTQLFWQKKGFGNVLGHFSLKRIWSPCLLLSLLCGKVESHLKPTDVLSLTFNALSKNFFN
jgi:hypothetical protein